LQILNKLIVAGAWLCLAFIIYATLSPIAARPLIGGGFFTVFERFGAYAVLGFLFRLAYPRHLMIVLIVVLGTAITLEVLQNFVPDRHSRLLDAMEKLLGAATGIALGRIAGSSFWPIRVGENELPRRN